MGNSSVANQIIEIARAGTPIPQLFDNDAEKVLHSLRPNVTDLFSNSVMHFLNLSLLLISNVNPFALPELNSASAIILYKGHGRPRDNSGSYSCIMTYNISKRA